MRELYTRFRQLIQPEDGPVVARLTIGKRTWHVHAEYVNGLTTATVLNADGTAALRSTTYGQVKPLAAVGAAADLLCHVLAAQEEQERQQRPASDRWQ